jgi:oligopeptide/dipeptide ABC transporter ATP-binding protein
MPLLEVRNLKTWYPVKTGWFKPEKFVRAVDGVSFAMESGETLGLVGESGCGKSTLGRTIVRLEKPVSGEVILDGTNLASLKGAALRKSRKRFQMIFQDPYGSLNPRMSVARALDEVLSIHTSANKDGRRARMVELLEMVGLGEEHLNRFPHQFSGGQRQRIGIARALAVEPEIIVADEPVSALDVSVQAQIVNLLVEIQKKTGVAFLFIAHDLAVVEHISDRIMVMYLGKIVESGPADIVCGDPRHPYTEALLSAVPVLDPETKRKRIVLPGDVPSPANPPNGCRFHPRCPKAIDKCRSVPPELTQLDDGKNHSVACHLADTATATSARG